jgi:hypothetical protein
LLSAPGAGPVIPRDVTGTEQEHQNLLHRVVEVDRPVRFGEPQLDALRPERGRHGVELVSVERSLVLSDDDRVE